MELCTSQRWFCLQTFSENTALHMLPRNSLVSVLYLRYSGGMIQDLWPPVLVIFGNVDERMVCGPFFFLNDLVVNWYWKLWIWSKLNQCKSNRYTESKVHTFFLIYIQSYLSLIVLKQDYSGITRPVSWLLLITWVLKFQNRQTL